MTATLRELENRSGKPVQLSAAILADAGTWLDGVAIWLQFRTKECQRDMAHCATINVPDWAARVKALAEIGSRLGAIEAIRSEARQKVEPAADEKRRLVALAALLTPPGWQDYYLPHLDKIREDASTALVGLVDVSMNQSIYQEIEKLQHFLADVASQGESARIQLGAPEAPRAGIAGMRDAAIRTEKPRPIRKLRAAAANGG